jgi:hypothetical protein
MKSIPNKKIFNCTKDEALRMITNAWHREPYSCIVQKKLEERDISDPDSEDKLLFIGKNWWDIDYATIESLHPCYFTIGQIPLQYFLPAFLIRAINETETDDFFVQQLVDHFIPPKKEKARKLFNDDFNIFSLKEREAICVFLKYMYQRYVDCNEEIAQRISRRILYALDAYWRI